MKNGFHRDFVPSLLLLQGRGAIVCRATFGTILLSVLISCTSGAPNLNTGLEAITANSGASQSHEISGAFTLPLVAMVTKNGTAASGVMVSFKAPTTGASGKFADTGSNSTTATTDSNGLATAAEFVANGTVGAYNVVASASGVSSSASFNLTNTTGAPATVLVMSGGVQSVRIDSPFPAPLVVTVVDSGGNPVKNAVVVFTAPSSGASGSFADTRTNKTTATTDASGVATSTIFTANSISGADTVTASAGAATLASFDLTNMAGSPATITPTGGTPQKTVISTPFAAPLVATVRDSFSNPVPGLPVTFTAPTSSASGTFKNGMTTETDMTNASGMATSTAFSANAIVGGPYTVTAAVAGVGTPADFTLTNTLPFKNYVFYLTGQELNTQGFYALAGVVQIDTSGNVIGGEQDYNDGGFGLTSPEPSGDTITGGTLTVSGTNGQGTLTLNTNNPAVGVGGTETLGVQFVNIQHALIVQFDGTATSSGTMDVQSAVTPQNGGYAFTLTGVDPNFVPVSYGGVFTISARTNLQNGLFDTNDFGSLGSVTTGSSLSGTLSTPDSLGRGTISSTINYTAVNFGTPAPVTLNYYVVGPEVLRIIDVDSQNNGAATSDSAIGSAFGQGVNANSAANGSLGTSVFGIIGSAAGQSEVQEQFAAAGMFTTSSAAGTFAGLADDDELTNGVQVLASPISGNYSVAKNGYGRLTITSGSLGDVSVLGIYLTDPNLNLSDPNNTTGTGGAVVADMDESLFGGTGIVIPQTDTSTKDFRGKYAFGGQDWNFLISGGEFDFVGYATLNSKGAFSGTGLVSDPLLSLGVNPTNSGVKFVGTPLADASNPGHYTWSSTNPKPDPLGVGISGTIFEFDLAMYQASGAMLLWLNEDCCSVFLGSLQQQGSLTGLPAFTQAGATTRSNLGATATPR